MLVTVLLLWLGVGVYWQGGQDNDSVYDQQQVFDEQPLDTFRRASQRMNVKLRILAQQVVDRPGGELPQTGDVPAD
jgi:hypothetical protein